MKQRVNIQYSVALDEMPAEISRRLRAADVAMQKLASEDTKTLSQIKEANIFSLPTLEAIENTRSDLGALDHILNDAAQIINGFIQLQVAPTEAPSPLIEENEEDSSTAPFPPKWNELTKQLENFKNKSTDEISE